tara:strand:- start:8462 stop:9286 length:825 start_codon:yes stop_codon:yes gene_type:complete
MTKISVVSTFHKPVLDLYGQRFVDSFSKNIDPNIELLLYAEDCVPITNDPRIKIFNHHAELPKLVAFKERWKNDPKANGIPPADIKARRPKDWFKKFKWNAVRFANKVYAVFDAAQKTDADWIVWMDADTYVHSPFVQSDFEKFLPNKSWLSYLGRGKKWPECGFYGINLKNPVGLEFLKEFEHVYEHAEYGIFKMEEWHDSFVFEEVRKKIHAKNPSVPIYNISGNIVNGEGHPLINSDLGKYLDHLKGDRKTAGKSLKNDLIVKRNESYWRT